ncbi:uncharacterized protein BDR25DRAFT_290743 [Lindgomyces ingoldianus]|uniref:Uncharacterized protein n=1 Tax=Lindgomyces ingoldianus TaxID=673940 RepID=A0ACB6QML3_9PLEO|nr:uncharacterized protein BDR25DRAFT_290743 [Lindgomyces ingoldianus]KAF2468135.1 hypothetical protein BDR25DRAFT_290743 [Lindgomyces ingoldianus]
MPNIELLPSQKGQFSESPIPYTGNPFLLCWFDILLFVKNAWSVIGVLHPWNHWPCGELDELCLYSLRNMICLAVHAFLIVFQSAFLISLPFLILFPLWMGILYIAAVMAVVLATYWILNGANGGENSLMSTVNLGDDALKHGDECWIYLNGVSVGKHWLRGNLNRLALTFRRPVVGVHNRTWGIVFDLVQCIIERNFCYATVDIRNAYQLIKSCLLDEKNNKVILILHSQGGIEGGLILDWLLCELPHDIIHKLEIYTFGCAANHFNNPHRTSASMAAASQKSSSTSGIDKAVRHIEHYAHDSEFVARWGVLSFTHLRNRYMGRVFICSGMGHLLNQHYLNRMFPLDTDSRVLENNKFMDQEVNFNGNDMARETWIRTLINGGNGNGSPRIEDMQSPVDTGAPRSRVRDFSRLWMYRNGGTPRD